ncbi:hypothetical protein CUU66_01180 [Peribacillus deserti]|uniref:Uncharacterized protein n=1 Tax=Peribacillus deserti TaxID=673318 RepID=A0A2N5MBQ9_9BACI|nr:hypothetical protein CUU66_01180 [Peribacillus deserti]
MGVRVASLGIRNSSAGNTLGAVVKKMQVFDGSGNSLGFVPIYDSITREIPFSIQTSKIIQKMMI